jgi:hypothetical protein
MPERSKRPSASVRYKSRSPLGPKTPTCALGSSSSPVSAKMPVLGLETILIVLKVFSALFFLSCEPSVADSSTAMPEPPMAGMQVGQQVSLLVRLPAAFREARADAQGGLGLREGGGAEEEEEGEVFFHVVYVICIKRILPFSFLHLACFPGFVGCLVTPQPFAFLEP